MCLSSSSGCRPRAASRFCSVTVPGNRHHMKVLLLISVSSSNKTIVPPHSAPTGYPFARQHGSRKSAPHLKTHTRRPARVCSRASAQAVFVLPWPEAEAAMRTAGQRTLAIGFLHRPSHGYQRVSPKCGKSIGQHVRLVGQVVDPRRQRDVFTDSPC